MLPNFPIITTIDDLRSHVSHLPEIRFAVQPNGYTVVCAMIADTDTYAGPSAPWARECRGITFDKNGLIVARPLHKFFNMNEREDTMEHKLNFNDAVRIMDKRDGSMIHPVMMADCSVVMKSKKSFESDVAIAATKYLQANTLIKNFCERMTAHGKTPIFEYTAPTARIVLAYPFEELRLLHIRDNLTGEYLDLDVFAPNIPRVDNTNYVDLAPSKPNFLSSLKTHLELDSGYEGFVIQFSNGDMVKAKTAWYLDLHHNVTFPTYRSVATMVLNETVDDFRSYLHQAGENDRLLEIIKIIEDQVVSELKVIELDIESVLQKDGTLERKNFAIKYREHKYFGLLMATYVGKEPSYRDYYTKNLLKDRFSTDQI
jgi:RNA ligase